MAEFLDLAGFFVGNNQETDKKEEKDQKDYLNNTIFLIDEMQKLEILTYTPYCQKGIFANYKSPIGGIEPYYLGVYDFLKSKQIIQEKPEGLDRFQYTINSKILNYNEKQFKEIFEKNKDQKDLKNFYKCFPINYGKLLAFLKNVHMTKTAPPPQQPAPQRGFIAGPQRVQGGTKRKKTRFITRRLRPSQDNALHRTKRRRKREQSV